MTTRTFVDSDGASNVSDEEGSVPLAEDGGAPEVSPTTDEEDFRGDRGLPLLLLLLPLLLLSLLLLPVLLVLLLTQTPPVNSARRNSNPSSSGSSQLDVTSCSAGSPLAASGPACCWGQHGVPGVMSHSPECCAGTPIAASVVSEALEGGSDEDDAGGCCGMADCHCGQYVRGMCALKGVDGGSGGMGARLLDAMGKWPLAAGF